MEEILIDIQTTIKKMQANIQEMQANIQEMQGDIQKMQGDILDLKQGQERIEKKVGKNYKLLRELDDTMLVMKEMQDEKINKLYGKVN